MWYGQVIQRVLKFAAKAGFKFQLGGPMGVLLAFFLAGCLSFKSYGYGSGELTPFKMKACGLHACYKVNAQRASVGVLQPTLFAMQDIDLRISQIEDIIPENKDQTILAKEGYVDIGAQRIVLKKVMGQEFKELLISIDSHQLTTY